jgi:hypothetical protein
MAPPLAQIPTLAQIQIRAQRKPGGVLGGVLGCVPGGTLGGVLGGVLDDCSRGAGGRRWEVDNACIHMYCPN